MKDSPTGRQLAIYSFITTCSPLIKKGGALGLSGRGRGRGAGAESGRESWREDERGGGWKGGRGGWVDGGGGELVQHGWQRPLLGAIVIREC